MNELIEKSSDTFQKKFQQELQNVDFANDMNLSTLHDAFSQTLKNSNNPFLKSDKKFLELEEITQSSKNFNVDLKFIDELYTFLSDANYSCKKPSHFEYFQHRYDSTSINPCDEDIPFYVLNSLGKSGLVWINPKNINEIHILFAGEGESLISQFGHIALRFVICPALNSTKEACDKNLYEHIIVGYRAHVNELKLDTLKGLTGVYNAHLFANNFMAVYQEYAINEFRNIYSLPLKLSKKEIENVARSMSQIHWSYSGDYKYFTANCSSLLQKALAYNWNEMDKYKDLKQMFMRPDSFFQALKQCNLTDNEKLNNLKKAEENGYFFPSTRPAYLKAFQLVMKSMKKSHYENIDEYMATHPLLRYKKVLEDEDYFYRLTIDKYLLNAQLMLEELSLINYQSFLLANMSDYFIQNDLELVKQHMKKTLSLNDNEVFSKCFIDQIEGYIRPIEKIDQVPMKNNQVLKQKNTCDFLNLDKKTIELILKELKYIDKQKWEEVEMMQDYYGKTYKNIEKYNRMLD